MADAHGSRRPCLVGEAGKNGGTRFRFRNVQWWSWLRVMVEGNDFLRLIRHQFSKFHSPLAPLGERGGGEGVNPSDEEATTPPLPRPPDALPLAVRRAIKRRAVVAAVHIQNPHRAIERNGRGFGVYLPGLIRAGQGVHGDGADVLLFHQFIERGGAAFVIMGKPVNLVAQRKEFLAQNVSVR